MAFDLNQHIATTGLETSLEGNYGSLIELTAPDGETIKTNEKGLPLKGQVLYDRIGVDPETADEIVVNEISVSLRKSALSRVPESGESWKISFPLDPADPDTLTTHMLTEDHAPIDGGSIGFIKLFPQEAVQS